MAQIRHIAILTQDTNKLATFYIDTFGLTVIMKRDKPNGAIYLSDGYINLAILPNDEEAAGAPDGLHHFGFHVDDVDQYAEKALSCGATQGRSGVPVDGRFAEAYVKDPFGQRVDLSAGGWAV